MNFFVSLAMAATLVKAVPVKKSDVEKLDLTPLGACENRAVIAEQSFKVEAGGNSHDGAMFVATTCTGGPTKAAWGEFKDGKLVRALPPHPANEWSVWEIKGVGFRDVDKDGNFDIVAVVSAMSGIGPEGAIPFDVAGVWYGQADGNWRTDEKANEKLQKIKRVTLKSAYKALEKK